MSARRSLQALALVLVTLLTGACASAGLRGASTTVVVVRHAERADTDPRDPPLAPAGEARAAALAEALATSDVAAVFTTQYRRTRDSGAIVAAAAGVEVSVRPIDASNASRHADDLAREILARHAGRTVVVVGHSNTVPELVEALGGGEVGEMSESEYDRLYLLVIERPGFARLISSRYGAPAP